MAAPSSLKSLAVPLTIEPMEAKLVTELPEEKGWQFEPKWDGFRCLAFRAGKEVDLRAKSGKPLARYFPEVVAMLGALKPKQFVLDGELAIPLDNTLSFDALQMRIHPAESRINKLAAETPAILILFDMLLDAKGKSLIEAPLTKRRDSARGLLQGGGRDQAAETVALHARPQEGGSVARRCAGRARRRGRQAKRRPVSPGDARHVEGQAPAHRRLRGGRLPLRDRQPRGGIDAARSLQQRRQARPCRLHFDHLRQRAARSDQAARSV